MNKDLLSMAVKFEISPCFFVNGCYTLNPEGFTECEGYYIERRKQKDDSVKWVITNGGRTCYSKREDDFIYECQPSSRTNEMIDDTRFDTIDEAFEVFDKWKEKEIKEIKASPHWEQR